MSVEKETTIAKCEICGKEFEKSKRQSAKKYCSEKCALEGRRYNSRIRSGNYARKSLADGLSTFVCAWCGEEFRHVRKKKYCSKKCAFEADHMSLRRSRQKIKITKRKKKPSENWASEMAKFNGEARKLGLSYGQYEARCHLEKRKVKESQERANQSSKN